MSRPMREIAEEIRFDWPNIGVEAEEWLCWLHAVDRVEPEWRGGDARWAIRNFLREAGGWRGERARQIKRELRQLLKGERK